MQHPRDRFRQDRHLRRRHGAHVEVNGVVGYPAEDPPPRPRYPLDYFLFENEYPELTEEMMDRAAKVMDEGYLAQDYYRIANYMVELEDGREETFTFDNYSWIEHMCRKWGQWCQTPDELLEQMAACGFHLTD